MLLHQATQGELTFQFHKGTIRTLSRYSGVKNSLSFQFHKGTIRTLRPVSSEQSVSDFNSIKVRLELKEPIIGLLLAKISIP